MSCHQLETLAWIKFTFIMSLKRSILLTNADISINIFQQNVSIELRGVIKNIYIYLDYKICHHGPWRLDEIIIYGHQNKKLRFWSETT